EHVRLEIERGALAPLRAEDLDGRRHFFSPAFCWALVSFTLLRIITRPPLAPGTAPRRSSRLCSGSTRTTLMFSTVRCSPPMRPGKWCPGHTRDGSEEAPIGPGARWNIEPRVASTPTPPSR